MDRAVVLPGRDGVRETQELLRRGEELVQLPHTARQGEPGLGEQAFVDRRGRLVGEDGLQFSDGVRLPSRVRKTSTNPIAFGSSVAAAVRGVSSAMVPHWCGVDGA
ncbi:hypothetical protein OG462_41060 [Streptomyces sp. NBC_01077]|uniref:hypothetical protein n=1 Tax=Streptomyces sp. NBC_01077 TaxID=2903746 RepID=UPI0038649503|nr:hypothetical protein OG462_41060 [Streptomyces sp. NBC_01077]